MLDGDPAPPTRKGDSSPHFSAYVCCGQTAGWIKMPLGTEVGLGPGHIVLDGDLSPPKRAPENFRLMSVVAKRLDGCLLWPNGRLSQQLLSSCYFVLSVPVLLIAWKDQPRNDLLYVSRGALSTCSLTRVSMALHGCALDIIYCLSWSCLVHTFCE